jgi:hypothetical protein
MHFHLPKPLHGWRAFAGEVGIIVVGVLIALAAEQVVEDWHGHQMVGIGRQSLLGELANDRGRWEIDMASARCQLRDIDQLERWAQAGASTAPPKPGDSEPPGSLLLMHSANWTLATGSETLDHFPIDEQLAFAALYDGLAHRQVDIERASELSSRIEALIPLATDAQARRDLRVALGEVAMTIGSLRANDGYMTRHFDALGVKPDRRDFAADIGTPCKP